MHADQSAQAKGWWRRLPGHHSAPHGLPAGSTPKCPWVALERNYHCNPQKIPFSPMLTVRLMSGISQPIPAHLVLINSRQALSHHSEGTDFWQECDSIQYYFSFTQFSSLTWHAPSHHEYCPHWAFQCESPWSLTCQKSLPSPLPKRLWDNEHLQFSIIFSTVH